MKTDHLDIVIRRPAAAFTLTELLVVIVIIITLATISFTGISRMRRSGDRVVALKNISQLQFANTSYAQDHNGQYVPIYDNGPAGTGYVPWMRNPEYLACLKGDAAAYKADGKVDGSIPTSLMDPSAFRAKKLDYNFIHASYGYNDNALPGGSWGVPDTKRGFRSSQLTAPERSAAFITGTDWNVNYANRFLWEGARAVEGFSRDQKIAYRHSGKALVVYYDGHVGEVSIADMRRFDTLGGANHIFWKANAP